MSDTFETAARTVRLAAERDVPLRLIGGRGDARASLHGHREPLPVSQDAEDIHAFGQMSAAGRDVTLRRGEPSKLAQRVGRSPLVPEVALDGERLRLAGLRPSHVPLPQDELS